MKKFVILLIAFSCCCIVFGKDGIYTNPKDADLYDFALESRTHTISGKLEKGAEVNLDFQNVQKSHNGKYLLLIKYLDCFADIFSDEIVPKDTDDLIPSEFKTQESDEYVWIAEYYMDVVKTGDREILREYRPAAIKKWGEPSEDYYDWYTYILSHNMVSNCVIELDLSQFFIENINIIENGFKIETDKYKLDEDMLSKSNKNMAEPHTLYFIYDGDTANVFVDDLNTKLYSMVKIKKTDYEKLENFIQQKTNLIQDFTFPRHADGTCDYEDTSMLKTAEPADMAALPEAVISKPAPDMGKTAIVTENLRLRTNNKTTAEVVTTLAAGTRVKVLAPGREDTIDGIASNWLQVRVLDGAKDKDGNAVETGTIGWLFGGYLSETESAESESSNEKTKPTDAETKQNAALLIVPIVAVGATLAVLLAVVIFAVVKKKKSSKE